MDSKMNIGLHKSNYDKFNFIIVPTTHFHMYVGKSVSLNERSQIYADGFRALLSSELPFEKVGIAHLTCPLIANNEWESHLKVIDLVSDKVFEQLFKETQEKGIGAELNFPVFQYSAEDLIRVIRPYEIAKECGCKFYFGSDAHHPEKLLNIKHGFERIVDISKLEESDKFLL